MSLNIGDNFSYLGKKFLDARESFATLADMKNCTDVPDGFITYCQENETRYEFKSSNANNVVTGHWREFVINAECEGGGGTNAVIQDEEPEDTSAIWFDPEDDEPSTSDPYMDEIKAIITAMSKKIETLTARVEYLENVITSGGGSITPNPPDKEEEYGYLLWDDGKPILWDDGTPIILEEQTVKEENEYGYLLWDDGKPIMWDDGKPIILEDATINVVDNNRYLLWDDGKPVKWDDGKPIIIER